MKSTYIIAEAGVNHNGSLASAMELIDVAVQAGADAVKFQNFKAEKLVSRLAPKADYQKKLTDEDESQFDMLKRLELSQHDIAEIEAYCRQQNIDFMCTPFDSVSLAELTDHFQLKYLKIPSGEINNAPFLLEIARTGLPVIVSTGMSTLSDVELALGVLAYGYTHEESDDKTLTPCLHTFEKAYVSEAGQNALQEKVTILHCTTEYPAPVSEVNLKVIGTLQRAFGLRSGYSDHTQGIAVAIAAVAMGAEIIEKHFTLNRNLPGPDHQASLEPDELVALVKAIREVESAQGNGVKQLVKSEIKNRSIARKSLVANTTIKKGELLTEDNVTVKRPGSGISPTMYWHYLGQAATRDYLVDELIDG